MWPVWTDRSWDLLLLIALFGASLSGCSKEGSGDTGETGAPTPLDADQDGVVAELDCDDNDPSLGAVSEDEDCDGLRKSEDCDDSDSASTAVSEDGDCDGTVVEEDCNDADAGLNRQDEDGDGVTSCDGDCDDQAPRRLIVAVSITGGDPIPVLILTVQACIGVVAVLLHHRAVTVPVFTDSGRRRIRVIAVLGLPQSVAVFVL